MKNIDQIKKLSTWDFAEFLMEVSSNTRNITTCKEVCAECEYSNEFCTYQIAEWLGQEVEYGKK